MDFKIGFGTRMKLLQDEGFSFHSSNNFCDEDGVHVWNFSSSLIKSDFNEKSELEEVEVVSQRFGWIIPAEIIFDEETPYVDFTSALEFCDSISGDLLSAYSAVADREGIRKEIIEELGLDELDSFESEVLIIEDIQYKDTKYLDIYLDLFDVFKKGLPTSYCRLIVVLFSIEKEEDSMKVFLKAGWKFKAIDEYAAIAYRKI